MNADPRHLDTPGLGARLALAACLLLGSGVALANAAQRGRDGHHASGHHASGAQHRVVAHRGGDGNRGGGHDYRGDRGRSGWGGGYYRAPPLVYGSPYYNNCAWPYEYGCAPPVVYGPSIGIGLPGVSVGIY
jgi:hypothetical protein